MYKRNGFLDPSVCGEGKRGGGARGRQAKDIPTRGCAVQGRTNKTNQIRLTCSVGVSLQS